MRVLGISPLDKDATVSFLEDGRVVFACAEERLSRVKLQSGFPHRALRLGLERTGWDPAAPPMVRGGQRRTLRLEPRIGRRAGRVRFGREAAALPPPRHARR